MSVFSSCKVTNSLKMVANLYHLYYDRGKTLLCEMGGHHTSIAEMDYTSGFIQNRKDIMMGISDLVLEWVIDKKPPSDYLTLLFFRSIKTILKPFLKNEPLVTLDTCDIFLKECNLNFTFEKAHMESKIKDLLQKIDFKELPVIILGAGSHLLGRVFPQSEIGDAAVVATAAVTQLSRKTERKNYEEQINQREQNQIKSIQEKPQQNERPPPAVIPTKQTSQPNKSMNYLPVKSTQENPYEWSKAVIPTQQTSQPNKSMNSQQQKSQSNKNTIFEPRKTQNVSNNKPNQ